MDRNPADGGFRPVRRAGGDRPERPGSHGEHAGAGHEARRAPGGDVHLRPVGDAGQSGKFHRFRNRCRQPARAGDGGSGGIHPDKMVGDHPCIADGKVRHHHRGDGNPAGAKSEGQFFDPLRLHGDVPGRPQEVGCRLQKTRRLQPGECLHRRQDGNDRCRGGQAMDAEGETAPVRRRVPGD